MLRIELDPHPTEARNWFAHKIYSTDVGHVASVKAGSEGVVKVIVSFNQGAFACSFSCRKLNRFVPYVF